MGAPTAARRGDGLEYRDAPAGVLAALCCQRLLRLVMMIACREYHERRTDFAEFCFRQTRFLPQSEGGAVGSWRQVQALPLAAVSALAHRVTCPDNGRVHNMVRGVTTSLKETLTALADALAKHPAEEILFDWFRSGRLVGELSVLIKRRHPEVQAEIDRVYREHLAKLGKRRRDPAAQDYGL